MEKSNLIVKEARKSEFKTDFVLLFLLFPIIGENVISNLITNEQITNVLAAVSCLCFLGIWVVNHNRMHIFFFTILLLVLLRLLVFIPIAIGEVMSITANRFLIPYGTIGYFMLFLLIETYIEKKEAAVLFKTMQTLLTILVIANFFLTADMRLPNFIGDLHDAITTGYTNNRSWLFGHRNMIFIHHLLWILFSGLYYRSTNRNYNKLFFIQISFTFIVAIFSWNATMIIGTVILFILYVMRNKLQNISIIHYTIVYLALEISLVFFRINAYINYFIGAVLNRNFSSLTGRVAIWDAYINQFINGDINNIFFGNFGNIPITGNTHNMFLGLLSFTGVIGVILFFLLYIISAKKLYQLRNDDTTKFVSMILFAFLINSLTMEFYLQPMLVLFIGYKVNAIIQNNQKNKEVRLKNETICISNINTIQNKG